MNQVPLWVPLLVGAIGLLATVGAAAFTQVYQANREDKRWDREEQERRRLHNLEDRKSLYTELLGFLQPPMVAASIAQQRPNAPVQPHDYDSETFLKLFHRLTILAPHEVIKACSSLDGNLRRYLLAMRAGENALHQEREKDAGRHRILEDWADVVTAIRKDVGTED
jgi:hypothetical protein